MFQTYFSTKRMLHKETQGESRVRENRTHGLVYEVKAWLLNRASFTLIELMLVVIIIGVLVAMVAPRFAGRSKQAKITAAKADIEANIAVALELFELDNGRYPTSEEGLNALRGKPSDLESWRGPYIKKRIPVDPWGNSYQYKCPGEHGDDYDLFSCGPDGVVGGGDDITNWEESASSE